MNVGVWAGVVLVVEVEMPLVVGGGAVVVVVVSGLLVIFMDGGFVVVVVVVVVGGLLVVVVDVVAFWHPIIEVIKTKLTTTRGKPEYLLFINALSFYHRP